MASPWGEALPVRAVVRGVPHTVSKVISAVLAFPFGKNLAELPLKAISASRVARDNEPREDKKIKSPPRYFAAGFQSHKHSKPQTILFIVIPVDFHRELPAVRVFENQLNIVLAVVNVCGTCARIAEQVKRKIVLFAAVIRADFLRIRV